MAEKCRPRCSSRKRNSLSSPTRLNSPSNLTSHRLDRTGLSLRLLSSYCANFSSNNSSSKVGKRLRKSGSSKCRQEINIEVRRSSAQSPLAWLWLCTRTSAGRGFCARWAKA